MAERPTEPVREAGAWRESRLTFWILLGVLAVLTAGTPLCFYLVPGFWAFLAFAALILVCWLASVAVLIPASAGER